MNKYYYLEISNIRFLSFFIAFFISNLQIFKR
jgi:hypothetical protein